MHLGRAKSPFFIFIWLQSLQMGWGYKFWAPIGNSNCWPSPVKVKVSHIAIGLWWVTCTGCCLHPCIVCLICLQLRLQLKQHSPGYANLPFQTASLWSFFLFVSAVFSYRWVAEPTPGFARENSVSSPRPPCTSHCPCASTSPYAIFVASFGTGWSEHSPALPSSWQWWQWAASWQVKPQLGLPGLLSSLSTSTDSSSLLQP